MSTLSISFAVIAIASIFQGTFGLGMKYVRPLAWEAWWLIYSTIAMLLLPVAVAFVFVPHLGVTLQTVSERVLFKAVLFGFLWGVGGILFGKSVAKIGIALTYGIVMGLAASVGSLIPLLGQRGVSISAIEWIAAGNFLMLIGVALSAWAGIRRERATARATTEAGGMKIGLAMAILSGLLSAFLNIGFAAALPIASVAVGNGALPRNASLAAWVVVLIGAFAMNAGYAFFLLIKGRTWKTFAAVDSWRAWKWALASGFLWFAALAVYGQGAALMGALGPVVGWPMLLALALILSNLLAVRDGEWQGAPLALRWMMVALAVLLLACGFLGYSNHVLTA